MLKFSWQQQQREEEGDTVVDLEDCSSTDSWQEIFLRVKCSAPYHFLVEKTCVFFLPGFRDEKISLGVQKSSSFFLD